MSTAPAMKRQIVNGVDVTAMMDTIVAIKGNPAIAKFNFRATNNWMGGDKNRTIIKDFTGALQEQRNGMQAFIADNGEPEVLLGQDEAPNPVEWLLHALIGCMTTTTAYHAAARGLEIGAIDSTIEGDLDLRGFLGPRRCAQRLQRDPRAHARQDQGRRRDDQIADRDVARPGRRLAFGSRLGSRRNLLNPTPTEEALRCRTTTISKTCSAAPNASRGASRI